MWKEPWFARHVNSIYAMGGVKEKKAALKTYLTNLVKFGRHYEVKQALYRKYLGASKAKRRAVIYAVNKMCDSKDRNERELGERLRGALKTLKGYNQYKNRPRPYGIDDPKKGFAPSKVDGRIKEDRKVLGLRKDAATGRWESILNNPRFMELVAKKYEKSAEFKAYKAEQKLKKNVVKAEELIRDLKGGDIKKRKAALKKLRAIVCKTTFKDYIKYYNFTDLESMLKLVPKDFNKHLKGIVMVDGDKLAKNKSWLVRDGSTAKKDARDIHRVLDYFSEYLCEAKIGDKKVLKKVLRIAESMVRGRARNALVKSLEDCNRVIASVNGAYDSDLSQLIVNIHVESDLGKLFKIYQDAKFLAQRGVILAQIKVVEEGHKDVSAELKKLSERAKSFKAVFSKTGGIELSGVTKDALKRAKAAIVEATKIFRNGVNRGNSYRFSKLVRKAWDELKWAYKGLKNNESLAFGSEADFLRFVTLTSIPSDQHVRKNFVLQIP
jgi:hypothetical protein